LERRAVSIECKIESASGGLDKALDLCEESLDIIGAIRQYGPRKAATQIADQCLGIIAQQNGTNSLFGARDQDTAERALTDREMDRDALVRLAALAGAEPSPLGIRRRVVESYILSIR
jgi:hypothetical protein